MNNLSMISTHSDPSSDLFDFLLMEFDFWENIVSLYSRDLYIYHTRGNKKKCTTFNVLCITARFIQKQLVLVKAIKHV